MTYDRRLLHAFAAACCIAFALPAAAIEKIGDCELSGPKGAFPIDPASPGQLTVQVHLPAPAWLNASEAHHVTGGFEYCLAANIAYRTGHDRIELVNVAWPGTAAGAAFWDAMLGGQSLPFDLALAEISITPERARQVDFSVPYFRSEIGMLAKSGATVDLSDVRKLRVGVHAGTTGADFVERTLRPDRAPIRFGDAPSMFMALQAGRIDVAMTDTAILLSQAAVSGGRFKVIGQFATGESYGAIYPKGSLSAETIDRVIQSLIDDGTVAELTADWLTSIWGQDPSQIPFVPIGPS